MSQYEHFTSLPPDKEREFVIFEKTSVETGKKAVRVGGIVAAAIGVLSVIVILSFDKPENKMANDDMGMLKRSSKAGADTATKPDPAKVTPERDDSAAEAAAGGADDTEAEAKNDGDGEGGE